MIPPGSTGRIDQQSALFRTATALHLAMPHIAPRDCVAATMLVLQSFRYANDAALQAGGQRVHPFQVTEADAADARAAARDVWLAILDTINSGADGS